MLGQLVLAEEKKLWKRTLFWVEVSLLILLIVLQLVSNYGTAVSPPRASSGMVMVDHEAMRARAVAASTWPLSFAAILSNVGPIAILAVIVLVGALVAQEYNWRALHVWLSRGVPRVTFIAAKVAALVLPLLVIVLIPLIVGGLLTVPFTLSVKGTLDLTQINWTQLLMGSLLTAYALLPYAMIALLLAVAGRSPVVAIGGGVALVVVDIGLCLSGTAVGSYVPFGLMRSLQALNAGIASQAAAPVDGLGTAGTLPPAAAVIGVAIWTLVCLVAAAVILWRQDLTD
jgi:ABC-type transport system involved in multi-copper enzyme maturation permease subunit